MTEHKARAQCYILYNFSYNFTVRACAILHFFTLSQFLKCQASHNHRENACSCFVLFCFADCYLIFKHLTVVKWMLFAACHGV
jgi:hypothetical protein